MSTKLEPIKFWCQKVLPLVYDDSLSYYEVLGKTVDYLNKVIEDDKNIIELVNNLEVWVNENKEYIDNYFENLNVQNEINVKLDEMVEDGTFGEIIDPILEQFEQDAMGNLSQQVSDWLEENITPTTPVIDATLRISGAGADAKVTGDEITDLKNALSDIDTYLETSPNMVNPNTVTTGSVISSNGTESSNAQYDTSDYIAVTPSTKYAWLNLKYVCRYGVNKEWKGRTAATSQSSILTAPDVYFVRVCGITGTSETWRFNKGNEAIDKPYIDGALLTEKVKLTNQLDDINTEIENLRNKNDLLTPSYGVPFIPSIPYNYNGDAIIPYKTSGHLADIYALYDALVEQYPQYIRKQVLGMDASGLYELRAYIIDNGTNYAYRLPRMVWLSSIHGNEGNSTISTYYMVKELLEKFASNSVCYGIMSAIRLYVIPAVNPWGVENYSRLNYNHVNLNRNFPVDWVYRDPSLAYGTEKYGIMSASNGDNPYYYYGGGTCVYNDETQTATTTYVAEPETQLIMNFINSVNTGANLQGKICFAINKHDAGNMTKEGALVLIRDNYESDRKFINNFLGWMKPQFMTSHNWLTQKNGLNLSTVSYDIAGDPASAGTMDKWLNYSGIHGGLCEIPKGAGTAYTDSDHFSDLCAINVSVGLNMISNVIVNNAKLKDNTQTEQYTDNR